MNSNDWKHYTLHELIILGRVEEFTERLSKEQDVDSTDADGLTLLQTALQEKNLSIYPLLELLLKKGADVKLKNKEGISAMDAACGKSLRIQDMLEKALKI